jgi:Xaa-Pro aminopeptidase
MRGEKHLNLGRLACKLEESGLDAIVASSPTNFFYLSGAIIITHLPIRDRLELVWWPREGEPVLILCDHEQPPVRQQSWIEEIRTYVEFEALPMEVLADVIRERGLEGGRIGMELDYLRAWYYEELRGCLPETVFVPCDSLLDQVRMIKTAGEIGRLREVAHLTEQAIEEGLAGVRPGDTEKAIGRRIIGCVNELGADGFAEVVAAGSNSVYSFPHSSERVLREGEVVRIDLKANWGGYASDVGRMAVVGAPTRAQQEVYGRLIEVHRGVIEALGVGVSAGWVYKTYQEQLEACGLSLALPFVGHSVGFGGQEFPVLQPLEDQQLESNMVLSLEPACDVGGARYKVEDTIWVREGGVEWLTDQTAIEEMIIIGT